MSLTDVRFQKCITSRPLKPWLVNFIQQIQNDNQSQTNANAVKIIECVSGPDKDGNLVRQVTDGSVYVKAIITGRAVRKCLEENDDDMPSWDKALILINMYRLIFEPYSSVENSEFVLIIDEFKLWDLQSGFDFKNSLHPCMNNPVIKKKLKEDWKKWKDAKISEPSESMTGDSITGSQLLSLLDAVGEMTPSDTINSQIHQSVETNSNIINSVTEEETPHKEPESMREETPREEPESMREETPHKEPESMREATPREEPESMREETPREEPESVREEHVDHYTSLLVQPCFSGPTLIEESTASNDNLVIDFDQPPGPQRIQKKVVSENQTKDIDESQESEEEYDFNSPSVVSLQFSCDESPTEEIPEPINRNSKTTTNNSNNGFGDSKATSVDRQDTISNKDAISENLDVVHNINQADGERSNQSIKCELPLETDLTPDSVIYVSIIDTELNENESKETALNEESNGAILGTQVFTPQITDSDLGIPGTQPFTVNMSQQINPSSDITVVEPAYQKPQKHQIDGYISPLSGTQPFSYEPLQQNSSSVSTCEPSQEVIFNSNSTNVRDNTSDKTKSSCYEISEYVSSNASNGIEQNTSSKSVQNIQAKSSKSPNGRLDTSSEVYQSTQKTSGKEEVPKFPLSPIQNDAARDRLLKPVAQETVDSLVFDTEYEEENRLTKLTKICQRLYKRQSSNNKFNPTKKSFPVKAHQNVTSNKSKTINKSDTNCDKASASELLMIKAAQEAECSSPIKINNKNISTSHQDEDSDQKSSSNTDFESTNSVIIVDCANSGVVPKNTKETGMCPGRDIQIEKLEVQKKCYTKLNRDLHEIHATQSSSSSSASIVIIESNSSSSSHENSSKDTKHDSLEIIGTFQEPVVITDSQEMMVNPKITSRKRTSTKNDDFIYSAKSTKTQTSVEQTNNSLPHTSIRRSPRIQHSSSDESKSNSSKTRRSSNLKYSQTENSLQKTFRKNPRNHTQYTSDSSVGREVPKSECKKSSTQQFVKILFANQKSSTLESIKLPSSKQKSFAVKKKSSNSKLNLSAEDVVMMINTVGSEESSDKSLTNKSLTEMNKAIVNDVNTDDWDKSGQPAISKGAADKANKQHCITTQIWEELMCGPPETMTEKWDKVSKFILSEEKLKAMYQVIHPQ